jgi:PAS domain S-box-containing protein
MGGIAIGPSMGSCGTAAHRGEPVMVCDIASDPLWADYRDVALAHGLRASWSTPIFSSSGNLLGTFAILSRKPRSPTPQHHHIIEQITHLASIAIERRRTESALQESEERFRRMADAIPEVIWFTALAPEKILYVSPSFERIWGLPVEKLYQNPRLWTETIHSDDRDRVTNTFSRWIAGEEVSYHNLEYRIVRPGGEIRWIHERGVLTLNEQGKARLASGISTDITKRKRAEEQLRRGEAYLAEAQRLSLTGSFGWNVASGDLVWSQETFCIMGYDTSVTPTLELVLKRVHPADTALVQETIDRATRDRTDFDFEHRLLMPEGAVKHVRVVARAAKDGTGNVEFIGALMDITERKQSQDALRAAKARFEGILEIAEDAIISVDSRQNIVLFNQGAENVFGYAAMEIMGKPLELLLPPRFAQAHLAHLEMFAQSPEVSRSMGQRREVFGRRKDGSEFPAEASISKLDVGDELLFTVFLRDITERKLVLEALHASEKSARGQAEALTRALDALARESSPDAIVEHVLRTMTRQLEAHSSGVWLRDETTGLMEFEFALEEGKFKMKSDATLATISRSLKIEDVWPWPEVFRTGKPSVLEDIRHGPDFPWRAHVLAQGVVSILIVPMLIAGEVAGVIGIRFNQKRVFRGEEMELAQALTNQAMLAIQLTRLSAQSRQAAVMAERNRLAREIHDTLAQGFTGVIVQLEAGADANSKGLTKEAEKHFDRAGNLARESLREARRSVRALRPQALEESNLCEALQSLIQKMTAGTAMLPTYNVQGQPRSLPPEWEDNILRIGQEVLTNALRHAHASEFKTQFVFDPGQIRLELRDNGRGFDPAVKHDGFGLLGMKERVEAMGGHLTIQSANGKGTAIFIVLPLAELSKSFES